MATANIPSIPAEPIRAMTPREAGHTLFASFLGWTLDAFDFFVLVFVLPKIGADFHRSVADIAFAITMTLAMRPIGAALFGWLADRYGRRTPLMIDVLLYSVVEVLSGLAPTYGSFLVLRALYGIGMGGEWGVGASLAMEAVAPKWRGFFSGLLQEGYAVGYLLAAAAYFFVYPHFGWRAMFFIGGAPALLTLYIRAKVPESEAWQRTRPDRTAIFRALKKNLPMFVYLSVFLTAMSFVSHGTQDMFFGYVSDKWGRRRSIATALILGIFIIPLWIGARSIALLTFGAFLMQFMVQGAFGVIPAHLSELSPPEVRGLFSGMAYQVGVLMASNAAFLEALIAERWGFANALGIVAVIVFVLGAVIVMLGPERAGGSLHAES
jgi:SHS family lactate transporter-like MFS transporter